jgi:hypothetical protein
MKFYWVAGVRAQTAENIIKVLYRTIGSVLWLDNLKNAEWQVIQDDIMPVLEREKRRRNG